MDQTYEKLVVEIINAAIVDAGSNRAFAKAIGVSANTVSDWKLGKRSVPAEKLLRAIAIRKTTSDGLAVYLVENVCEQILKLAEQEGDCS